MRLLRSGEVSEKAIQSAIMDFVRVHPGINHRLIFHVPNEGRRSKRTGKELKTIGMRPGVSDIHIAMQRHGYGAAWIELKSKNGRLSAEQKEFLDDMRQQNYFTAVCWSIDEGIKTIEWYVLGKTK